MKLQKMFSLRTLTMALVFGLLVLAATAQGPSWERGVEAAAHDCAVDTHCV